MPLRDLFCLLEATEKPSKAPLIQSIAFSRAYGATLSALVAGQKASAPYSLFGGSTVAQLVQSENAKTHARADSLTAEAKSDLSSAGVKGEVDACFDNFQDLLVRAKSYALCNDLTILDRPGGALERSEILFEEMLFSAGRPVLLPVPDAKPVEKIQKLVLAWDGSPHATRALSSALALFEGVKEADVVVVRGEKDLSNMVPATRIAAHIERHGVKAKVVELNLDEESVSSTIDKHTVKSHADLVVMGAFGRSRIREFVLGGVTRDLTRSSSKPLLLSH